jgi:FeS assembly SUF system protein
MMIDPVPADAGEDGAAPVAVAGEPLAPGLTVASEDAVVEALRQIYDPEIPVNIYDLGLIYTVGVEADGKVLVEMTLTAPGCPVAGDMPQQVADVISTVPGTGEIAVYLVWDPPWTMANMSEDARLALNL